MAAIDLTWGFSNFMQDNIMQKIKSFLLPLSLVCLLGVTTVASAHETADDKQFIRHTINSIYDIFTDELSF